MYRCPYCSFETDHLLVYLLHLEKHERKLTTDDFVWKFSF